MNGKIKLAEEAVSALNLFLETRVLRLAFRVQMILTRLGFVKGIEFQTGFVQPEVS